ncbi:hypothetical protein C0992_001812 [Termitomyces sp. T32_za158]|nr:hypothetical protein C0992_001812 [Termitomyces sp. T32_za158]
MMSHPLHTPRTVRYQEGMWKRGSPPLPPDTPTLLRGILSRAPPPRAEGLQTVVPRVQGVPPARTKRLGDPRSLTSARTDNRAAGAVGAVARAAGARAGPRVWRPFVAYYGLRCLLWETSTFFLNIHWFMDKTGRTGSTAQFVNGMFLLSAFFGVRLVYGGKVSIEFMRTLIEVRHEVPRMYVVVFGTGNVLLTGLNWLWWVDS